MPPGRANRTREGKNRIRAEMPPLPQRVTIFGVGLSRGSFALALKRAFPEIQITGVDKPDVLDRARQLRIIDTVGAVYDRPAGRRPPLQSDVVVLATPVGEILKLLDQFTQDHKL